MKTVTACTRDCPDACSLLVEFAPDGSVRIEGNPAHPVTAGVICKKTREFGRALRSPNRITEPLLRANGGWQAIGWDEALDLCASRIQQYRSDPASILHVYSMGSKGVTALAPNRFFGLLGASRVVGSLCDTAGNRAFQLDFGRLESNDVSDLPNARRIVNWGKDLSRSSIHTALYVRQARTNGAEVWTISPGGDGNRLFSDRMIRVRPGTDRFLAAAVIRLLIESDRIDPGILERTGNWPAFRSVVMAWEPEALSAACGVPMPVIEDIAAFYTGPDPVATIVGIGLQRYSCGGENVRFINALGLVSGQIGRSGGGNYFTISSTRNFDKSGMSAPGEEKRRTFFMPTIGRDIIEASDPPVRMIWVNGTNLVNQSLDCKAIAHAFEQIEFKVVVDAFMNDTAERADLILPCSLMLEREDVVGSWFHNYVNYAAPVVTPPAGARTDLWIVRELGKRLDPAVDVPAHEDYLRTAVESPQLNVTLEDLKEQGFVRGNQVQIAWENGRFAHPDGLYRFPEALHTDVPLSDEYPMHLLSLVRRNALHSQILPEDHPDLPAVWVSRDCPHLGGVDLQRDVYLASPLGRIRVRVERSDDLHPDAVMCRRGLWMKLGGGFDQLVEAGLTDIGECSPTYSQGARLEN